MTSVTRRGLLTSLGAAGVSVGAGAGSGAPPRPRLAVTHTHADDADAARIGTYVSSEDGFLTSSSWIEGPTGLILIDTQFLLSAAEELVQVAESSTGKKVVLAVVLHPNPDKFNGTAVLARRGIRVVTSAQVKALVPAVHELRKSWFFESYKPDYPETVPALESFGDATRVLEAGGVNVKLHVLGRGCSGAHVVAQFGAHLFPGDLVTNDFHSWLELGHLRDWLERLDEMKAMDAGFVHPGRGPGGTIDLLDAQAHYLRRVIAIVEAAQAKNPAARPDEAALEALQGEIVAAFPGLRYPRFVSNGLAAAWERLRA